MRAFALLAILAGCGRIGFDSPAASDGALGDGPGDGTTDGSPSGAATVTFVGTMSSEDNLGTYTFSGFNIGAPAANRIIVVSAFLGGGAFTPITSITVNGTQLVLAGGISDPTNGGSIAIGYKTIPTGTTAAITVTSAAADRAAVIIYRVTAQNETPTERSASRDQNLDTSTIGSNVDFRTGEVVIANAGNGSNNATWTWGGTWLNYTEVFDSQWFEQGAYSSATATADTDGPRSVLATPSVATPKLYNVTTWR